MVRRDTVELNKVEHENLLNRIKFFQTIIREISSRKPLKELLDQIMESSKKLLNAEASSLLLFEQESGLLKFHSVAGGGGAGLKSKDLKPGEGIAGWVALNKETLIINDCYSDSRFNKDFDISTGFHTRNMVCAPMINRDSLVGVIQVINKKQNKDFTREDQELFEALAAQCAVAIENAHTIELEIKAEQAKNEMDTAWRIQQKFLPEKIPALAKADLCIRLKPAKEIGGDYFNVIKIDDDNFLLFIADVSGKSVPAALIVSTLYSFLQFYFIVQKNHLNPVEFVAQFNRFLIASTTPDKFVTAWFGFYNQADNILLSINAGHNPPYLLRRNSNELFPLKSGGMILGTMDFPYDSEKIELAEADMVIYFTDGVTEAMNEHGEEYGEERFEKLILNNKTLSPAELSKVIHDELKLYRGSAEQSDDITLGIIKF